MIDDKTTSLVAVKQSESHKLNSTNMSMTKLSLFARFVAKAMALRRVLVEIDRF